MIHDTTELQVALDHLEQIRKDRLRVRKAICVFMRKNQDVCTDRRVLRKISGGYLGDLRDQALISAAKKIGEGVDRRFHET